MNEERKPLDEQRLFILAVRHCLRDGVLDVGEHKLLKILIRFLRIPPAAAREWIGKTLAAARSGSLGEDPVPMEPKDLFVQAVRLAMEDGILETMERDLLTGLATALEIDDVQRDSVLRSFGQST